MKKAIFPDDSTESEFWKTQLKTLRCIVETLDNHMKQIRQDKNEFTLLKENSDYFSLNKLKMNFQKSIELIEYRIRELEKRSN